jgi:hypothetical protein
MALAASTASMLAFISDLAQQLWSRNLLKRLMIG